MLLKHVAYLLLNPSICVPPGTDYTQDLKHSNMVTFMPKTPPRPLPLAFAAASAAASASSMDNAHVIWRDSNNMIANDTTNDDAHI